MLKKSVNTVCNGDAAYMKITTKTAHMLRSRVFLNNLTCLLTTV